MENIMISPVITEKTSALMTQNKYTFFVSVDAEKIQVRRFLERAYNVHVEKVNLIKVKPKKRRRGKAIGLTTRKKKAIITLRDGESIEVVKEMF